MDLIGFQILLIALIQLTAVQNSDQAASNNNVPFKTSFVSTNDFPVRRNGALISLPLSNVEAQHQPDAIIGGSSLDSSIEDQSLRGNAQNFFRDEHALQPNEFQHSESKRQQNYSPLVILEVHQSEENLTGDLLAAPSIESNNGAEALPTSTTSRPSSTTATPTTTTTTTTTATPTTTTTTTQPSTTTSSPSTTASAIVSTSSTGSASTEALTNVPATSSSTQKSLAVTELVVEAERDSSSSPTSGSTPSSSTSSSGSSSEPTTSATSRPTTTTQNVPIETTTTTTARPPTTVRSTSSEPIARESRRLSAAETNGGETDISETAFASNRSSAGGSSACEPGSSKCGFIVSAVPTLEKSISDKTANKTRFVNEFIFVPADSALNFEESVGFARPNESGLRAEHRSIEGDGDSLSSPANDDLELDYMNSESESAKNETPSGKTLSFPAATLNTEPRPTTPTTFASTTTTRTPTTTTTKAPTTTTTTTTTTTSKRPQSTVSSAQISRTTQTPVASSTSLPVETSTTSRPASRTSQSSSYTVRVSQKQTPRSSKLASTAAPATSTRRAPTRANQRISRLNERVQTQRPASSSTTSTTSTTSTVRPSAQSTRRPSSGDLLMSRRAKSQHRQFFSEPISDLRRSTRKPSSIYWPMANGADEEEAKILTRFTIPSQLARLASTGARAAEQRRPASAELRPAQLSEPTSSTSTAAPTGERRSKSEADWRRAESGAQRNERRIELAVGGEAAAGGGQSTLAVNSSARHSAESADKLSERQVGSLLELALKSVEGASGSGAGLGRAPANLTTSRPTPSELDESEPANTREVMTLIASSHDLAPGGGQAETGTRTETETETETESEANAKAKVTQSRPLGREIISEPTRAPAKLESARPLRLAEEVDEYEGSVEDQLAKDDLVQSRAGRRIVHKSTAYGAAKRKEPERAARQPTSEAPFSADSGKWQPSEEESQANNLLPGRPGQDYPIHWQVPRTSFDCRNYEQSGFYADVESDCQAYHSCHRGRGGRHTFLCPNGTLFSQELLTCDWWYNVECSASKLYLTNEATNSLDRRFNAGQSARTAANELSVAAS